MNAKDRGPFLLLACLTGVYVIMRAARVPLVHDECASLLWYVQPGEWLPDASHWDANNHFLSTGLGVLFHRLFGLHPLALRLGSVLAFAAYALGCWRLGVHQREGVVRWSIWIALMLCPFVLDFFALFRGYAIELAAWIWTLDGLFRFAVSRSGKALVQVLVSLLIGTSAMLSMLPVWLVVLASLGALITLEAREHGMRAIAKQGALLMTLGVVPALCASLIALRMQDMALLYNGSTEGFITVTLRSLTLYVLGTEQPVVIVLVLCSVVVATAVGVRTLLRAGRWTSPLILVLLLLWGDVVLRILLARLRGVNYPEDRSGIHFVPLVILVAGLAAGELAQRRRAMRWSVAVLWVLPLRTVMLLNMDHTELWPEQSVPSRFMAKAGQLQYAMGRPLLVGGYHQLALAWPVQARLSGVPPMSLQTEGFPAGLHDLRIVDRRFLQEALPGYGVIDSADGPGLWMLKRARPLEPEEAWRAASVPRKGSDEFFELAQPPDSLFHGTPTMLELTVPVQLDPIPPDLSIVLEVNDAHGDKLFYRAVALGTIASHWALDNLRQTYALPAMPGAARAVLYVYNPRKVAVELGEGAVRLSLMRP